MTGNRFEKIMLGIYIAIGMTIFSYGYSAALTLFKKLAIVLNKIPV